MKLKLNGVVIKRQKVSIFSKHFHLIVRFQVGKAKGDTNSHLHRYSSCLLYTSPSPRDRQKSRMPSSA